jgi:hypothetical protein
MVKNRASKCGNHSWIGQPRQGRDDDWTRYGNGGISGRHSVTLARRHRGQEGREREWDGQREEREWRKGALCKHCKALCWGARDVTGGDLADLLQSGRSPIGGEASQTKPG